MGTPTLGTFLIQTRRLLHDASGNYWSDDELTDYINEGQSMVAADTGCSRFKQTMTTLVGQEAYTYHSIVPKTVSTIDVLNITLLWGNSRIVLGQMSFSEFNPKFRTYVGLVSRPIVFAKYGQIGFYLGPAPDQVYHLELDTVVIPDDLVNATDICTFAFPYTVPIPYYAAHKAKFKEQSYIEAETFKREYVQKCREALVQTLTRVIPSLYSPG